MSDQTNKLWAYLKSYCRTGNHLIVSKMMDTLNTEINRMKTKHQSGGAGLKDVDDQMDRTIAALPTDDHIKTYHQAKMMVDFLDLVGEGNELNLLSNRIDELETLTNEVMVTDHATVWDDAPHDLGMELNSFIPPESRKDFMDFVRIHFKPLLVSDPVKYIEFYTFPSMPISRNISKYHQDKLQESLNTDVQTLFTTYNAALTPTGGSPPIEVKCLERVKKYFDTYVTTLDFLPQKEFLGLFWFMHHLKTYWQEHLDNSPGTPPVPTDAPPKYLQMFYITNRLRLVKKNINDLTAVSPYLFDELIYSMGALIIDQFQGQTIQFEKHVLPTVSVVLSTLLPADTSKYLQVTNFVNKELIRSYIVMVKRLLYLKQYDDCLLFISTLGFALANMPMTKPLQDKLVLNLDKISDYYRSTVDPTATLKITKRMLFYICSIGGTYLTTTGIPTDTVLKSNFTAAWQVLSKKAQDRGSARPVTLTSVETGIHAKLITQLEHAVADIGSFPP